MKTRSLATSLALVLATSAAFAQHSGQEGRGDPAAQAGHGGHTAEREEAKRRNQLRATVQDICPVSGEKLGSMGAPLKVQVGKETIYLCCKGCVGREIQKKHWATIHTNIAKAQGVCPVMGHELPAKPKWTIVEGQVVYVCCPPCTEKLAAEPQKYLRDVDTLYAAAIEKKKEKKAEQQL